MSEHFLEEQLARIRRLSEQMAGVEQQAARVHEQVARDRELMRETALHQARDLRLHADDRSDGKRRRR